MDNENFADLFNGYLFQGEQVVKAEELSDVPSEYELSLEEKNKGKKKRILRVSQYRDVIKKSTAGTEYVILGIENQEKIHYNMPVRTMLYDAVTYTDQLKRIAKESKNYKTQSPHGKQGRIRLAKAGCDPVFLTTRSTLNDEKI